MYSSKTYDKGQKLTSRGNHSLNHDVARLLKTQDAGYLKTMAQSTRKAREKLQREYVLKEGGTPEILGENPKAKNGKHVLFVESRDEQRLSQPNKETLEMDINPSKPENFHDGMTDREVRKPQIQPSLDRLKSRKFSEIELGAHKQIRAMRKRRKRNQEALRSKLEMLRSRERDLLAAEHELDLQRAKMSNSVGGVNKAGLKFKVRERKR